MLRSLVIDNFRAFKHFEMDRLGRINLLVGTNNCGKTSVLEAIRILAARETFGLVSISMSRGARTGNAVEVRHLFHGRALGLGRRFMISGEGAGAFTAEVARGAANRDDAASKVISAEEDGGSSEYRLALTWNGRSPLALMRLLNGSIKDLLYTRDFEDTDHSRVEMLDTRAVDEAQAVRLLDEIILTPEESTLIEALRSIEPTIDRIASASSAQGGRSSIFVKCTGIDERIPIGSMGDGISRLLGIALHLVAARGGVLLIDEIDTGLHYSVMETMWKLVCKTAERLDIQVFATTHSRDCYEALAAISRADAGHDSQVSIQRIEKGKTHAVAFTEPEIVIAARRGIEVR